MVSILLRDFLGSLGFTGYGSEQSGERDIWHIDVFVYFVCRYWTLMK